MSIGSIERKQAVAQAGAPSKLIMILRRSPEPPQEVISDVLDLIQSLIFSSNDRKMVFIELGLPAELSLILVSPHCSTKVREAGVKVSPPSPHVIIHTSQIC